MRRGRHLLSILALCALALSFAPSASADTRSDYLINMLETGATYRIRVQAATTLGMIRCAEAVPALGRALSDEDALVVIAAANALGQIGDAAAIPAIEAALKNPPSPAAKTQLETTLRVLRALVDGGDSAPIGDEAPRYLIRIDAMGDSSGAQREGVSETMKTMVVERLRRESSVILQPAEMKAEQVKTKVKKEKLKAFILTGSIMRLERTEAQIVVKISLNVFSNPGYSLLAMPSAEGSVTVSSSPMAAEAERAAQDRALKAVVDALVGKVLRSLDDLAPQ